jgi:hypothetical protein
MKTLQQILEIFSRKIFEICLFLLDGMNRNERASNQSWGIKVKHFRQGHDDYDNGEAKR